VFASAFQISFLILFVGESRTSVDFSLYEIALTTSAPGSEGDSFLNFRRRDILLVPHREQQIVAETMTPVAAPAFPVVI
jgi:hypothetical protein